MLLTDVERRRHSVNAEPTKGSTMKLVTLLAMSLAIAAPSAASSPAVTPTPTQQLRTYLAKVQPLYKKYHANERGAVGVMDIVTRFPFMAEESAPLLDDHAAALAAVDDKLTTVRPPTRLREPHRALLRSVRLEEAAVRAVAEMYAGGEAGYGSFVYKQLSVDVHPLQRHWRTEVVRLLRLYRLVVPFWVTSAGR